MKTKMNLRDLKILTIARLLNTIYGDSCWSKAWKADRENFLELSEQILKISEGRLK